MRLEHDAPTDITVSSFDHRAVFCARGIQEFRRRAIVTEASRTTSNLDSPPGLH